MVNILIVEDDIDTANIVEKYLVKAGFDTHIITQGDDVVDWVRRNEPDLILLDLMLPKVDGLTILRKLRTFTNVPVIITTARVEEIDRLKGFETGADDYVCKPYSAREIVARVRTWVRRTATATPENDELTLYPNELRACYKEHSMELSGIEFKLLQLFHQNPGRIYSREHIIEKIYDDYRIISDRTVDSHIRNLRKKIRSLLDSDEVIQSVYGAGYKYSPPQ